MVRYMTPLLASLLIMAGCGNDKQSKSMAITVNLRYTGTDGNARKFAEEMISSGTVDAIRAEEGNLRYEYYQSLDDPETILLIGQSGSPRCPPRFTNDGHHLCTSEEIRSPHDG